VHAEYGKGVSMIRPQKGVHGSGINGLGQVEYFHGKNEEVGLWLADFQGEGPEF